MIPLALSYLESLSNHINQTEFKDGVIPSFP